MVVYVRDVGVTVVLCVSGSREKTGFGGMTETYLCPIPGPDPSASTTTSATRSIPTPFRSVGVVSEPLVGVGRLILSFCMRRGEDPLPSTRWFHSFVED